MMKSGPKKLFLSAILVVWFGQMTSCAFLGGGGDPKIVHNDQYSITAPSDWTAISPEESDYAFRLPSGNIATATSSCKGNPNAPLEILTRHLLFGARNITFEKRERIKVDGVEGLLSVGHATLDGNKFRMLLFVMSHHECVFDFTIISRKGIAAQEEAQFLKWVKSYRYGKS